MNIPEDVDEEIPFEEAPEADAAEKKTRRRRKAADEAETEDAPEEMTGAKASFEKAKAKYGTGGDTAEETPKAETPPATKRTRRKRA